MSTDQPTRSRTTLFVGLGIGLAAVVFAATLWLPDGGEDVPDPAEGEEVSGSPGTATDEGHPPLQTAANEQPCSAEGLARIRGVEVGATILTDWRVDAIGCEAEGGCTLVDLTRPPSLITLRVCAHREGTPLAPATHGTSDVFYGTPRDEASATPEDVTVAVLTAFVERLGPPAQ